MPLLRSLDKPAAPFDYKHGAPNGAHARARPSIPPKTAKNLLVDANLLLYAEDSLSEAFSNPQRRVGQVPIPKPDLVRLISRSLPGLDRALSVTLQISACAYRTPSQWAP